MQDFIERMHEKELNRRAMENLIKCGAFDGTGAYRAQLLRVFEQVMDGVSDTKSRNIAGQIDLFGLDPDAGKAVWSCPTYPSSTTGRFCSLSMKPWACTFRAPARRL